MSLWIDETHLPLSWTSWREIFEMNKEGLYLDQNLSHSEIEKKLIVEASRIIRL